MASESTVLLVHETEPPQSFLDELEKRGVFVETARPEDIERVLTVVGPDLILYLGSSGAREVVARLAKIPRGKRVRLALLVERSALEAMRQLDRSVVSTVLPDDLAPKSLHDRIVFLANRNSEPAPPAVPRPLPPRPALPGQDASKAAAPQGSASAAVALPATTARRLALVDDDVTRADAMATALRQQGFGVQTIPADPARTRWLLLRRFAPEIVVTDSARPPQSWLRHMQSDEQLKGVLWIAAPYLRMFDETSGAVSATPLFERLSLHASERASGEEGNEDDDRPTLVASEEEDRPTLVVDESHRAALAAAAEARPSLPEAGPRGAVEPERSEELTRESELEIEDLDSLKPEPLPARAEPAAPKAPPRLEAPPKVGVIGIEDSVVVRSSMPGAPPLLDPPPSTKKTAVLIVTGILLLGGGGGLYLRGEARSEVAPIETAQAALAVAPAGSTASTHSAKAEPKVESAAPDSTRDPWRNPEDESVPRCERQGEYSALPEGDAAQASRFLDKARAVLVLGDWAKSRDLMCRAVLMHEESLALEGLAESYLRLHAPSQAKHWGELARTARPNRARTLELLADIESQLGAVEEARADLVKALGVPPGDQKSLDFVAESYVREGTTAFRGKDFDRAEILFRRAAALGPSNGSAAAGLARTLVVLGRKEQAARWAELAAERAPEHPDVLVAQGDVALSGGDAAKARACYERALKTNPAHYIAREQLAKLL